MSRSKTRTATKVKRSAHPVGTGSRFVASVLDTLIRAGLITLGMVVVSLLLWGTSGIVRAIATNGVSGLFKGFLAALAG